MITSSSNGWTLVQDNLQSLVGVEFWLFLLVKFGYLIRDNRLIIVACIHESINDSLDKRYWLAESQDLSCQLHTLLKFVEFIVQFVLV